MLLLRRLAWACLRASLVRMCSQVRRCLSSELRATSNSRTQSPSGASASAVPVASMFRPACCCSIGT